jgi:ComF family protein
MISEAITVAELDARAVDIVLCVPLSQARLAERGYNQAWELARRVARQFHLRADATALQKPVDGAHQAALERSQRIVNLRGAFMVDPARRRSLEGRRVALVDDVMTTGATAREATQALIRAGVGSVVVWTFARTP